MSEAAVLTNVHATGWAEVILNRPERKNAITGPLGEALAAAVTQLNARDDVQVILLRGAGGAFCSGLDREGLPDKDDYYLFSWIKNIVFFMR